MNYSDEKHEACHFFDKCLKILTDKANDYASDNDVFSNFKKIAYMVGVDVRIVFLVFMAVKLACIRELIDKPNKVNESISDSLMDIANYACLMEVYIGEETRSIKRTDS